MLQLLQTLWLWQRTYLKSALVSILRKANYSGYVILEYEAADEPLEAIPVELKAIAKSLRPV